LRDKVHAAFSICTIRIRVAFILVNNLIAGKHAGRHTITHIACLPVAYPATAVIQAIRLAQTGARIAAALAQFAEIIPPVTIR
jgi:hypothetical protein